MWINDNGIQRWCGPFPEPTDEELLALGWVGQGTKRRHGTVSAYRRHRDNGEAPCEPCKAAHAAKEAA